MLESREFRELLIADVALVRRAAEVRDVAAALMRYWDERDKQTISIAGELARIAGVPGDVLSAIESEVDQMIAEADGDARLALTRRGGLDRSIHVELSAQDTSVSEVLTQIGVGARAPLRPMTSERYVDFVPVGEGGMGVVYMALDTELNRFVALKMVRPDVGSNRRKATPTTPLQAATPARNTPASQAFEELKARFLQEAWVTGGIEHPGVVPVYELGQTPNGIPYYTMRLVRGQRTFKEALEDVRGHPVEDRLPLLEPFLKLCDTVAYAHSRGVIHRDLKPENVALGEFGEVILLDWGLAKLEGHDDVTASRWQEQVREFREVGDLRTVAGAIGTPGYMSPEATLGQLDRVDQRSDVYSLGVILYEILTGQPPYPFLTYVEYMEQVKQGRLRPAHDLDPSVPEELSRISTSSLSRERAERPESVAALSQAIRRWQITSQLDREVEERLHLARAALDAADAATGEARLHQVDRAAAALAEVEAKRPDAPGLTRQIDRSRALRELGIRERGRANTRRVLVRVGVVALVLVAVAGYVVAASFERRRQEADRLRGEAEDARSRAHSESEAKTEALGQREVALEAAKASQVEAEHAANQAQAARKEAEAAAEETAIAEAGARSQLAGFLVEQGRRELLESRHLRAATYLRAAIDLGEDGPALRFLVGEVLRRLAPQRASVALPACPARAAAFTGGGPRVVTGAPDAQAEIWDPEQSQRVVRLGAESQGLNVAAFSEDGRWLVGATDQGLHLWDARSGASTATLTGHEHPVNGVCVSTDATRAASVDRGGHVRLWELPSGKSLAGWQAAEEIGEQGTWCVAFDRAGARLVTAGFGQPVTVWQVDDGGAQLQAQTYVDAPVYAVCFGTSDDLVAFGDARGHVVFWDPRSDVRSDWPPPPPLPDAAGVEPLPLPNPATRHQGAVFALAFSSDGRVFASAGHDGRVRIWSLPSGRATATLVGHAGAVYGLAIDDTGSRVLSAGYDKTARMWDPTVPELPRRVGDADSAVWATAVSADGTQIATGQGDGTIVVETVGDSASRTVIRGTDSPVRELTFDVAGARLVSIHLDGAALLHRVRDGALLRRVDDEDEQVGEIALDAGRKHVLTASWRGHIATWETSTLDRQDWEAPHEDLLRLLRLSRGGGRVALVAGEPGDDERVEVRETQTGELVSTLDGHELGVRAAEFSGDGRFLVTGGNDQNAVLWDLEQQRPPQTFSGHRAAVVGCAFSPNQKRLATATEEGFVFLWSVGRGELLGVLEPFHRAVRAAQSSLMPYYGDDSLVTISFSEDGGKIVVAGGQASAHVWGVESGRCLAYLQSTNEPPFPVFAPGVESHAGEFVDAATFIPGRSALLARSLDHAFIWAMTPFQEDLTECTQRLDQASPWVIRGTNVVPRASDGPWGAPYSPTLFPSIPVPPAYRIAVPAANPPSVR